MANLPGNSRAPSWGGRLSCTLKRGSGTLPCAFASQPAAAKLNRSCLPHMGHVVNDMNRATKWRETINPIDDSEDNRMNGFKFFALAAVGALCFAATTPNTQAQVEVGIGVAPVCPYGYYDVPPYDCAPYGYYGPEWFAGGVFIGAGPWFHGSSGFHGHVNNRFHPDHGYHGPMTP